jgi:hypothetical protein
MISFLFINDSTYNKTILGQTILKLQIAQAQQRNARIGIDAFWRIDRHARVDDERSPQMMR